VTSVSQLFRWNKLCVRWRARARTFPLFPACFAAPGERNEAAREGDLDSVNERKRAIIANQEEFVSRVCRAAAATALQF
jgi:hypothetical protein